MVLILDFRACGGDEGPATCVELLIESWGGDEGRCVAMAVLITPPAGPRALECNCGAAGLRVETVAMVVARPCACQRPHP